MFLRLDFFLGDFDLDLEDSSSSEVLDHTYAPAAITAAANNFPDMGTVWYGMGVAMAVGDIWYFVFGKISCASK